MKERGYNQCELISKEIATKLGIKYNNNIIIKTQNNSKQSDLNKNQRKENVIGKYKIKEQTTNHNKNILLFDDIITTGNTLKECAKTLNQTNPKKIGVLTIANRTLGTDLKCPIRKNDETIQTGKLGNDVEYVKIKNV